MADWRLLYAREVRGEPKGQPRPRAFASGGKARVYDPGTAEGWKGLIAAAFADWHHDHGSAEPIEGPVRLEVDFLMPRPQRLMRKKDPQGSVPHLGKPDLDNLWKAVADTLTTIGVWRDDAQVCSTEATKYYHAKDGQPGAVILICVPGDEP